MLTREDVERYLVFGFIDEFDYPEPIDQIDIDWENAKHELKIRLKESLDKIIDTGPTTLAICGTNGSCYYGALIDRIISTHSATVPNVDTDGLTKSLGLEPNYSVDFDVENMEQTLIEMNSIWETPRFSFDDIYDFTRQKHSYQNKDKWQNVICEGGHSYTLCTFREPWGLAMHKAIKNGEYKITKASKYLEGDGIRSIEKYSEDMSYLNSFLKYLTPFKNLDMFGMNTPRLDLREENVNHLMVAMWAYAKKVADMRTQASSKHFGLNIISPLIDDEELVNFCISLPFEMKFCLGNAGHILKKSVALSDETKNLITKSYYPSMISILQDKIFELAHNYLTDKDKPIFDYLPFEPVQEIMFVERDVFKVFRLLNLEVWLEVH